MAVSKQVLGMNARNFLYIRKHNKSRAKARADDKLRTKELLIQHEIPTTNLLVAFRSLADVRAFDWHSLPRSFALKPAQGYGGEGIRIVQHWDGTEGVSSNHSVTAHELESNIFDILDGAYSRDNLPDVAFIEERVIPHSAFKKISAGGVPDIRVIVFNRIPIMAMVRLPTVFSGGKANLHLGALGAGIDLRTGITTLGVVHNTFVQHVPDTKIKVRGIKIPSWDYVLEVATRTQEVIGLGYAGIDIVIDDKKGPLVLEVNARPGLSIQMANGSSLRTRLERVGDMLVPSTEHGIELAKRLFAERALASVVSENNILQVIERVTLFGTTRKKTVLAKIDTGAFRTSIDGDLVEELDLPIHHETVHVRAGAGTQTRDTVRLTFKLRDNTVTTIASYTDRTHMTYPVIIGQRDLAGFLIDPAYLPKEDKGNVDGE